MNQWNVTTISSLGILCIPPVLFFALFLYNLNITYPEFEDLSIKRGILEHFAEGNKKNSMWITLLIDGRRENIRIPRRLQILQLSNEIGNVIEVRYGLKKENEIKIWHLSTGSTIYIDYNKEIRLSKKERVTHRNICFILFIYTILVYSKNHGAIKEYIFSLNIEDKIDLSTFENASFKPCNFNLGLRSYLISISIIYTMYLAIFSHTFFLIPSIFLSLISIHAYTLYKKNKYTLTLSKEGIQYELFKEKIHTDYIKWSEIEKINYTILKGRSFLRIYLLDKNKISKSEKILSMTSAIYLDLDNFEKNQQIKNIAFHQIALSKELNDNEGRFK